MKQPVFFVLSTELYLFASDIIRSMDQQQFMTMEEVAKELRMSYATFRARLSRGFPAPPSYRPPGCRRRLFKRSDVVNWIMGYQTDTPVQLPEVKRRRGRPTKAEQLNR